MKLLVNGAYFNRISYIAGAIKLEVVAPDKTTVTKTMDTTMHELETHYGRRTAYLVKQAFLANGVDPGGSYAK